MTKKTAIARIETGVRNLDALFGGGLPKGSIVVIAGPPGAGKTILTQQICFHNASARTRVLYFSTLSEPTAKTLRYLNQFDFFDAGKIDGGIQFVDLGAILRTKGLDGAFRLVMDHVKKVKPSMVVIDSFKVFDDLAKSKEELRKFGYELAINLMAWETTTFFLGEFGQSDIETNPLFSIVDGLIMINQRQESGEQRRVIQIVKMRGTDHSREEHSFAITRAGIDVFAPRFTIHRAAVEGKEPRLKTGISRLDELLGDGIPRGSTLLIAGVAGTGKTVLSLEFIYRGAKAGEKGIFFSFEESEARLRATARGLGWDLDAEIERGMVEIVFIPQPDILVEGHLLMISERILGMKARRVVVDSVSVFLHKVRDPQVDREKVFQLASVIHNAQAVGFLATDIPYGTNQISRFGVEETVVDGVILLSSTEEGLERQRYIEIYKLRNTAHLRGRHSVLIGPGGLIVYPRYNAEAAFGEPPPPLDTARRLPSGVPGLDGLLGGGLLERSVTLLSGSAGIGKSTLSMQFLLEGCRREEPGLYLALEEGPAQLIRTAEALGLPLQEAIEKGLAEVIYLSRERVRPSQFLSLLTDKIRTQKTRRFVLDSVSHLAAEGIAEDELRQLLYALITRFKALGVTTVLTLESSAMYSSETVTDRRFSPVADNLVVLRYTPMPGEIRPTLMVVKTRGSEHDFGAYHFIVGKGGARIGRRADLGAPLAAKNIERRRRTKK
ncbi:ATPase domain-containing protein [Sorangium atrum]|uniref:ATPase domain-containing protein n=1 Tax=Sorangium atrum TaxID=2995308 RepID=A0ABT5C997_9BACT|nr:ATPase domain-containing protein [Sorangium aterium]MDC0681741.1 ATPase domain-containing protein [Sorangium aterium]